MTEKSDGAQLRVSTLLPRQGLSESVRADRSVGTRPMGIESSLHWGADVRFDKDQHRGRQRRSSDNRAWLRRSGIRLLNQHPSEHSIPGKSRIAGWSNQLPLQVLALQQPSCALALGLNSIRWQQKPIDSRYNARNWLDALHRWQLPRHFSLGA